MTKIVKIVLIFILIFSIGWCIPKIEYKSDLSVSLKEIRSDVHRIREYLEHR